MPLRLEQIRTLYAVSTLKAPLATTLSLLLGDPDRRLTSQKLERLVAAGFLDKSPYGSSRVMYMLSGAGRLLLDKYLRDNPKPVLETVPSPAGTNAHRAAQGYVPKQHDPNVVPPRTTPIPKAEYAPEKDKTYYRNDGNRHIPSRGPF